MNTNELILFCIKLTKETLLRLRASLCMDIFNGTASLEDYRLWYVIDAVIHHEAYKMVEVGL